MISYIECLRIKTERGMHDKRLKKTITGLGISVASG